MRGALQRSATPEKRSAQLVFLSEVSTKFLMLVRRTVSYYRFNTDWSIRMLKIASCGLDRKRAKSLGTLETSGFRGFLGIRG